MHKRYSFPGIVVTSPEPIKEETETPLIGKYLSTNVTIMITNAFL